MLKHANHVERSTNGAGIRYREVEDRRGSIVTPANKRGGTGRYYSADRPKKNDKAVGSLPKTMVYGKNVDRGGTRRGNRLIADRRRVNTDFGSCYGNWHNYTSKADLGLRECITAIVFFFTLTVALSCC